MIESEFLGLIEVYKLTNYEGKVDISDENIADYVNTLLDFYEL